MKVIIEKDSKIKKNNSEYKLNMLIEWLIYMLSYAFVLFAASNLFRSLYIENFIYGFIAAIIIYFLNKTIKPFLVFISIPIIGITLGVFYFFINVIILLLTSLILGNAFSLTGFLSPVVVAMFISAMNLIMENLIIKPFIERCKR